MEKFYMIIKLKENQVLDIQKELHTKDVEIKKYKEKAFGLEKEIQQLKCMDLNTTCPELHAIIDDLKSKWIHLENEMQNKIIERNNIFSELMVKKQEIKSIEMLIEKKRKELNELLLKKEQDTLDELNSIE